MDNKKTMTKKEIKEWDELYQYIKKDILQYDDNKKLPKWFVLRLKGLNQGKFCANNNIKSLGYYGFDVILLTFKIKKFDILIALKNSGVKGNKRFIIALVICFIYACTDEYHQTFVNGRTGQFSDTLIDTFGGFVSCLMYTFMMKINKIRKKHI